MFFNKNNIHCQLEAFQLAFVVYEENMNEYIELSAMIKIYKTNKKSEQRLCKMIEYIFLLGERKLNTTMDCKSYIAMNAYALKFFTVMTFLFFITSVVTEVMKNTLVTWTLYLGIIFNITIIIYYLLKRKKFVYILIVLEGFDALKEIWGIEYFIEKRI